MSSGAAMTMTVTGFADVGGIRCAVVESDVGGQVNKAYYAADSQGLKDYGLEIAGQKATYDPPIVRIKLPFVKGQRWTSAANLFDASMTTDFESLGTEQIQTQAGTFQCIVIRSSASVPGQGAMVADSYYADGQGFVHQKLQTNGQEFSVTLVSSNVRPAQAQATTAAPAPPAAGPLRCSRCGALVDANTKFCPECGTKIVRPAAPTVCPKCGGTLPAGAKFCPACGERVVIPPVENQTQDIAGVQPAMEQYVSPMGTIMLYKPPDWSVIESNRSERGYAITVANPQETAVVVFITLGVRETIADSVALAGFCMTQFGSEFSTFQAKTVHSTPDKERTIMEISFTDEGERGFGRGYFFYTQRVGTVYLLLCREGEWTQLHPTLAAIAANIAHTPDGIEQVMQQGREQVARAATGSQGRVLNPAAMLQRAKNGPGRQVTLVPAALPDRSLMLQIPQGWGIEGQEQQYVLFDNPQTRGRGMCSVSYSIIPTEVSVPGVINAPYQAPPEALGLVFQFTRSGTNVEILAQVPGEQAILEITQAVQNLRSQGLQVDSRLMHVRFQSAFSGATLRGLYTVQCSTLPMSPVWQVVMDGSWAPDTELEEWLPLYLKIGETFQVNPQWQQAHMQAQASRQRQLNRGLQNAIAERNQAFDEYLDTAQEASRSQDYVHWLRRQTTIGQGTWVAENEGAHVYTTDEYGITGPQGRIDSPAYNTTHFTGQNPWDASQLERIDTRAEFERYLQMTRSRN
jgi:RNA polymerase subunit RPABC4/transcription elongation factor Spt4